MYIHYGDNCIIICVFEWYEYSKSKSLKNPIFHKFCKITFKLVVMCK